MPPTAPARCRTQCYTRALPQDKRDRLPPLLLAPVLLGLPLHSRCICVLHFEPIGGAPGTVGGILALRDNPFEAKLAGVGEDGRAVALDMLVELDARAGLGHDRLRITFNFRSSSASIDLFTHVPRGAA